MIGIEPPESIEVVVGLVDAPRFTNSCAQALESSGVAARIILASSANPGSSEARVCGRLNSIHELYLRRLAISISMHHRAHISGHQTVLYDGFLKNYQIQFSHVILPTLSHGAPCTAVTRTVPCAAHAPEALPARKDCASLRLRRFAPG